MRGRDAGGPLPGAPVHGTSPHPPASGALGTGPGLKGGVGAASSIFTSPPPGAAAGSCLTSRGSGAAAAMTAGGAPPAAATTPPATSRCRRLAADAWIARLEVDVARERRQAARWAGATWERESASAGAGIAGTTGTAELIFSRWIAPMGDRVRNGRFGQMCAHAGVARRLHLPPAFALHIVAHRFCLDTALWPSRWLDGQVAKPLASLPTCLRWSGI